jgi:hypothetical protein
MRRKVISSSEEVLYESMCKHTRRWVTWKKLINRPDENAVVDALCDGVMYRKYKGTYYVRTDSAVDLREYGAVADYNPRTDVGTANDAALAQALRTLLFSQQFIYNDAPPGWKGSGFRIYIPRGNYLFTQKKFFSAVYTANRGITIEGDGAYATNLFFRNAEAVGNLDNYMFYNDNLNRDVLFEKLRFSGVTGTEKFYYYSSTGTASTMQFNDCAFDGNFKTFFDVQGNTNCSENRFNNCKIKDVKSGQTFLNLNNPQSVNWSFSDCDFEGIAGTAFNITKGGVLKIDGGSLITTGTGVFMKINDTTGTGIGATNGLFHINFPKTEIRDESQFLDMNCPAAIVTMVNPFMQVNNAVYTADWATATSYAVGGRSRIGGVRGRAFKAKLAHTSDSTNQPLTGANWTTYWDALYEISITSGSLNVISGSMSPQIRLNYKGTDWDGTGARLYMDSVFVGREPASLVDIINTDANTNVGARPKPDFINMDSGSGPNNPATVSLNVNSGYSRRTSTPKKFFFRAATAASAGLPSSSTPTSVKLPLGCLLTGVGIVSEIGVVTDTYTVSNSDATLISQKNFDSILAEIKPVVLDTDARRTISISSNASSVKQGYFYFIYQ